MKKTVLITGAAKRLGKEMAKHLAQKGWDVAIHYNSSAEPANMLREELMKCFPDGDFQLFQANLANRLEVENLVKEVLDKMGHLDLLINNASVFESAYLKNTDFNLLNEQMAVNFQAPFLLIRDFAKMVQEGVVVNLVDTRITSNKSNYAAYSLSKKVLWELTKMAALEFAPDIRINAIAPGAILPPEDKDENYLWDLAEQIPMKRPGGVEPILRNLDYILDNEYMTGQLLFADGGENLGKNQ
ncbi:SDR family NAD(P)-dependent oxidoreductase [Sunxiuqinia sp. A32]|uniref:SDR family NAD(P)-dependent oxidoreductase n=1 Tax=Sunxiuqinia sp. A32 TaxID=3461496 RepID=UPI0040456778